MRASADICFSNSQEPPVSSWHMTVLFILLFIIPKEHCNLQAAATQLLTSTTELPTCRLGLESRDVPPAGAAPLPLQNTPDHALAWPADDIARSLASPSLAAVTGLRALALLCSANAGGRGGEHERADRFDQIGRERYRVAGACDRRSTFGGSGVWVSQDQMKNWRELTGVQRL